MDGHEGKAGPQCELARDRTMGHPGSAWMTGLPWPSAFLFKHGMAWSHGARRSE